ncbi:MAG: 2-hydroxyglutaryl-CoA dehydratase [Armatimonadetes bacterium]|nr:2-hydroxyglutaryl-CoA dehydratase [Armatimonadota bacterium]
MRAVVAGLDLGSVATKAVVCDAHDFFVLGHAVRPTGWRPAAAAEEALAEAMRAAGVDRRDLRYFGITGYGRDLYPDAAARATEVTCQAWGVHHLAPDVRTILDIGGQDTKALRLDEEGRALDFALNDRCAAGTGRFLEVMARALEMSLEELGLAAARADEVCPISATCTVFAESEVVGLLAQGQSRDSLAAGLCHAIARQVIALAARVGIEKPVALVGGVAYNEGVRKALREQLEGGLIVPGEPQFTAALGAAILAAEMSRGEED